MYDELVTLLSPDEFAPLKPLVLLLGWNYVYSCDSANNLLDALHEPSKVRTGFNRSADFLFFLLNSAITTQYCSKFVVLIQFPLTELHVGLDTCTFAQQPSVLFATSLLQRDLHTVLQQPSPDYTPTMFKILLKDCC